VRALGLDLSLTRPGLVVRGDRGVLDWRSTKDNNQLELEERIDNISRDVVQLFKIWQPDLVVLEGGARGGKFVDLKVYNLVGVVRWRLWKRQAPLIVVPPNTVKLHATGNGRASKPEMLEAARDIWPECPHHDCADGFWLAHYGQQHYHDLVSPA
jgi:Holliday junction resolvasome RuvABC endonuclease subunit